MGFGLSSLSKKKIFFLLSGIKNNRKGGTDREGEGLLVIEKMRSG